MGKAGDVSAVVIHLEEVPIRGQGVADINRRNKVLTSGSGWNIRPSGSWHSLAWKAGLSSL